MNPVRPEVIDALDELERSLGDVSRWEQLLTGKESPADWERPGTAPERGRHLPPGHLAPADEDDVIDDADGDDPDGFGEAAVALQAAIQNLDDRIEDIRTEGERVRSGPLPILDPGADLDDPPAPPLDEPVAAAPILLQARTVEPIARRSLVVSPEDEDEIDRRRRNGRLLTWVGLALLVAVGAVFFLPDDKGDDEPEAPVTVPSVSVTTNPFITAPLLPADDVTSVPVVPIDEVTTTSKPTTQPTKKSSTPRATTPPATSPPTTPATPPTQPPLVTPGTPPTNPPATTPTTPPTEPTTTDPTIVF
ncbi:MAG: hypothetical protein M3Z03_04895 [Actinomycetota bacterium]|nr:hypothetical protein [Actinomycetota bacterium]